MSKIHILENGKVVLHCPIISGNNASGKSWKDIFKGVGLNKTCLTVETSAGVPIGSITATEKTSIEDGDTMEFCQSIKVESTKSPIGYDQMCDPLIEQGKEIFKRTYNHFGYIQG